MWRLPIILRVTTADISNYIHFDLGSAFADICLLMFVYKQDYTKTDGFARKVFGSAQKLLHYKINTETDLSREPFE